MNNDELMTLVMSGGNKEGCNACDELVARSDDSDEVYQYFDLFLKMLDNKNSYVRNRAFSLITANVKWDTQNLLDSSLDDYLQHVTDEKPITARLCIQSLNRIVVEKPQYLKRIKSALETADFTKYKDSMRPLIEKEKAVVLNTIVQQQK